MEKNNFDKQIDGVIEKDPSLISTIFFVRHGATEYKEYTDTSGEKVEKDLLPKGEDQIKETAGILSKRIDKDFPVRIITSGRVRTKQSADIIKESLNADGISMFPDKIPETRSFEATRLYGDPVEVFLDLNEKYGGELNDLWRDGRLPRDKIESMNDVMFRVKDSFLKVVDIIRKNNQIGHRDLSQTILVSHGEIINALMVSFDLEKFNDGERVLRNGGVVEIQIFENRVIIKYEDENYTLDI